MDDLAPVLGVTAVVAMIAWSLSNLISALRRHKLARLQADLHSRLLEKFGSSQELLSFLQTEAGGQFVQPLSTGGEQRSPYSRILGSLQVGVILVCAGGAFLFLHAQATFYDEPGILFLGSLGVALGVGFLVSGALAYGLSRRWGLLETRET